MRLPLEIRRIIYAYLICNLKEISRFYSGERSYTLWLGMFSIRTLTGLCDPEGLAESLHLDHLFGYHDILHEVLVTFFETKTISFRSRIEKTLTLQDQPELRKRLEHSPFSCVRSLIIHMYVRYAETYAGTTDLSYLACLTQLRTLDIVLRPHMPGLYYANDARWEDHPVSIIAKELFEYWDLESIKTVQSLQKLRVNIFWCGILFREGEWDECCSTFFDLVGSVLPASVDREFGSTLPDGRYLKSRQSWAWYW